MMKTATNAARLADQFARHGYVDSARALVARNPGPVVVIEIRREQAADLAR